jgi:predicted RNase H-like HicB family nuclease
MSEVDCFDDDVRPEYLDWSNAVRGKYAGMRPSHQVTIAIEVAQLSDGRWGAHSAEFPDAIGFGEDAESALREGEALIEKVLEGRIARGEIPPTGLNFAIDYR